MAYISKEEVCNQVTWILALALLEINNFKQFH